MLLSVNDSSLRQRSQRKKNNPKKGKVDLPTIHDGYTAGSSSSDGGCLTPEDTTPISEKPTTEFNNSRRSGLQQLCSYVEMDCSRIKTDCSRIKSCVSTTTTLTGEEILERRLNDANRRLNEAKSGGRSEGEITSKSASNVKELKELKKLLVIEKGRMDGKGLSNTKNTTEYLGLYTKKELLPGTESQTTIGDTDEESDEIEEELLGIDRLPYLSKAYLEKYGTLIYKRPSFLWFGMQLCIMSMIAFIAVFILPTDFRMEFVLLQAFLWAIFYALLCDATLYVNCKTGDDLCRPDIEEVGRWSWQYCAVRANLYGWTTILSIFGLLCYTYYMFDSTEEFNKLINTIVYKFPRDKFVEMDCPKIMFESNPHSWGIFGVPCYVENLSNPMWRDYVPNALLMSQSLSDKDVMTDNHNVISNKDDVSMSDNVVIASDLLLDKGTPFPWTWSLYIQYMKRAFLMFSYDSDYNSNFYNQSSTNSTNNSNFNNQNSNSNIPPPYLSPLDLLLRCYNYGCFSFMGMMLSDLWNCKDVPILARDEWYFRHHLLGCTLSLSPVWFNCRGLLGGCISAAAGEIGSGTSNIAVLNRKSYFRREILYRGGMTLSNIATYIGWCITWYCNAHMSNFGIFNFHFFPWGGMHIANMLFGTFSILQLLNSRQSAMFRAVQKWRGMIQRGEL